MQDRWRWILGDEDTESTQQQNCGSTAKLLGNDAELVIAERPDSEAQAFWTCPSKNCKSPWLGKYKEVEQQNSFEGFTMSLPVREK